MEIVEPLLYPSFQQALINHCMLLYMVIIMLLFILSDDDDPSWLNVVPTLLTVVQH